MPNKKSHFADSNRRPTHYECVALPTELKWHATIKKKCPCRDSNPGPID